jgi:hypothetical protein
VRAETDALLRSTALLEARVAGVERQLKAKRTAVEDLRRGTCPVPRRAARRALTSRRQGARPRGARAARGGRAGAVGAARARARRGDRGRRAGLAALHVRGRVPLRARPRRGRVPRCVCARVVSCEPALPEMDALLAAANTTGDVWRFVVQVALAFQSAKRPPAPG